MNVKNTKDKLVQELSQNSKIKGIGQTGDINAALIPGNSDIDMFVLCTTIPTEDERKSFYSNYSSEYSQCLMNVCSGGIWGYGDILIIDDIDVMFMYFTLEEMDQYLDEVLNGKYLDREGGFYPSGRLSSVEDINILYESDAEWTSMVDKVKKHPNELFDKMYHYHISNVLNDEDLGRVLLRKEVMFYHSVLESSLDHLLQALFAINSVYFPSRKRNEKYIKEFKYKPNDCYNRFLNIIENSISCNTIAISVEELKIMTSEIKEIGNSVFKK